MSLHFTRNGGRAAYFLAVFSLSTLLLVLVNLIGVRCDRPIRLPGAKVGLSERSQEMLASLRGNITCTTVLPQSDNVFTKLRNLLFDLRECATNAQMTLEFLDPHTDLARSADAVRRYGATGWCVVFDNGLRTETVPYDSLFEYARPAPDTQNRAAPSAPRFSGEAACMTALLRLTNPGESVIYTLSGHGERDFSSYDPISGYSDFAREIAREGYVLRRLDAGASEVPDDCSMLVIAGPQTAPADFETLAIVEYLNRGGALMALIDRPSSTPSGWEAVLSRVGVMATSFTAISDGSLGDYRLLTDNFADHPAARGLARSAVCFVNPLVLETASDDAAAATPVIMAPRNAWGETNPDSLPRHFDPDFDRRGDLPLAVAAEGPHGEGLGIRSLRAFVIGDSNFASNALLDGGSTANRDFLMNAANWLVSRTLAASPSAASGSGVLRLAITRGRQIRFWTRAVALWPLVAALLGIAMAAIRKATA